MNILTACNFISRRYFSCEKWGHTFSCWVWRFSFLTRLEIKQLLACLGSLTVPRIICAILYIYNMRNHTVNMPGLATHVSMYDTYITDFIPYCTVENENLTDSQQQWNSPVLFQHQFHQRGNNWSKCRGVWPNSAADCFYRIKSCRQFGIFINP